MSNRLEKIINLKLNNFEIVPPKEDMIEPTKVDLADYPWDQCIADQIERYGDEEVAKRVCGAIKALYAEKQEMESKQEFVIPQPEGGESESEYIGRCMSAISGEYDTQEQALAVCYAQLEK